MPSDVQVHDFTWTIVTSIGYVGLFYLFGIGLSLLGILWQVNCILREKVIQYRLHRGEKNP